MVKHVPLTARGQASDANREGIPVQVEHERAQAGLVQDAADVAVARAVPTAAAAVGEDYDPGRVLRHGQVAGAAARSRQPMTSSSVTWEKSA